MYGMCHSVCGAWCFVLVIRLLMEGLWLDKSKDGDNLLGAVGNVPCYGTSVWTCDRLD